ncbi:MAG TPA: hypothetical protein ENJ93_04915 [Chloroflexi bacterium]|nr:hypothetical protein [Chloroflexota bacterium]
MNRLEWILGIVLVVLLIAVAVVSLLFWFGPRQTAVTQQTTQDPLREQGLKIEPTSVYEGSTAKVAYAAAQNEAQAWQADAELLNASATWPQGATAQQLLDGETSWGFTFYSPSAQEVAVISVVEDQASLISTGPHTQENPVLNVSGWNLDSQEVIRSLLEAGGNDFINQEQVTTLTTALFTDDQEQNGRMEWQASLISLANGRALTLRIDATSGEILDKQMIGN